MKPRLLVATFLAALVAFAGLAVACDGGGEELTLQEYFQRVDAIFADADARIEALPDPGTTIADPQATLEQKKDTVRDFLTRFVALAADVRDEMAGLQAPPQVQDAHSDFLAFWRDIGQAGDGVLDRLEGVQSESEFDDTSPDFFAADFFAIRQRFPDVCSALQAVADANDIAVDLACAPH